MKIARLLVLISRTEGRSNVVMEAMASRCSLVVSDISGTREILDDRSAFFVERYKDPESVANVIMAAYTQRAEAARRSDVAFERVNKFTISAMVGSYEQVYETVVARRGLQ